MSRLRRPLLLSALTMGAAVLAGCGGGEEVTLASPRTTAASDDAPVKIIDVVMVDHDFQPSSFRVQEGQEVLFRFRNEGSVTHEAVIGDEAGQKVHGDDLADDGAHSHEPDLHGPAARHVDPGGLAEISYTFDEEGTMLIGCHEPGHWEDGMVATVEVV